MSNSEQTPRLFLLSAVTLAVFTLTGCGQTSNIVTPPATTETLPLMVSTTPITTSTPPELPTPTATTTTNTTTPPAIISTTGIYKDGTYSATGEYRAPSGAEEIGVSLTLKDDIITDVSVDPKATVPISKNMQNMFAQNYKTFVVGKNIAEVNVGKVSGSSLTPHGFNDAITKIKLEAAKT